MDNLNVNQIINKKQKFLYYFLGILIGVVASSLVAANADFLGESDGRYMQIFGLVFLLVMIWLGIVARKNLKYKYIFWGMMTLPIIAAIALGGCFILIAGSGF
jgi:hypothetical protein